MTGEKVCVVGIWHLGSVVSACLADLGYSVVGVDRDEKKVESLNNGTPPLFEPGLTELISSNIKLGRLRYTTDLGGAVKGSKFVLITLDTPVNEKDEIDLSELFDVAIGLSMYLENDSVVVVSSQVPVGTCDQVRGLITTNNPSIIFDIAYSPENLRLGNAIQRFKIPGRIVIGANRDDTLDKVEELFSVVNAPIIRMNLRSAEMTKHAINAFLGMSISFINEIANICDELGADALQVASGLRSDERIGQTAPLNPGLGFAGGTLARDLKILQELGTKVDRETHLVNATLKVNETQNRLVIRKLLKVYDSLEKLSVGVFGLTYKPGTSTLRRSAALQIIHDLVREGVTVKAYDPKADLGEVREHKEFQFCSDPQMVADGCDALIMITEWPEFKNLDFNSIKQSMKRPVLIDTQNMLDEEQMREKGFLYFGVGRGGKLNEGVH
ncbi:MAG: UDP-glucose/GDP-mannose dehydrogenase family protein [Chloroflexi bacterium]|nr:UDP-glucose/GDP-mannose dehydrogenase family protein [Chloroflexota bacterium]